jgi:hypothetical protein
MTDVRQRCWMCGVLALPRHIRELQVQLGKAPTTVSVCLACYTQVKSSDDSLEDKLVEVEVLDEQAEELERSRVQESLAGEGGVCTSGEEDTDR